MARSLGAVLVTDMVGSTQLLGALGTDGAIAARRTVDSIVKQAVDQHEGMVVDTNGDGHVARFATGSAALLAALAIQQTSGSADGQSSREPVRLRIGLSAGEFDDVGGPPAGRPLDEASALEQSCRPGAVLTSATLLALIAELPAGLAVGVPIDVHDDLVGHEVGHDRTALEPEPQ